MQFAQVTCCLALRALASLQAALSASSCGPSSATSALRSLTWNVQQLRTTQLETRACTASWRSERMHTPQPSWRRAGPWRP